MVHILTIIILYPNSRWILVDSQCTDRWLGLKDSYCKVLIKVLHNDIIKNVNSSTYSACISW